MKRKVTLGVVGTVVALAGVGGVAYAQGSNSPAPPAAGGSVTSAASPSPAPPSGERERREHRDRRGRGGEAGGRTLHGQFTVQGQGGTAVVDVQRGQVTTASPTSVQVKSTDGFTASYAITGTTRIRDAGKSVGASDLTAGKQVAVVADDNGGHPAARGIRVLRAR